MSREPKVVLSGSGKCTSTTVIPPHEGYARTEVANDGSGRLDGHQVRFQFTYELTHVSASAATAALRAVVVARTGDLVTVWGVGAGKRRRNRPDTIHLGFAVMDTRTPKFAHLTNRVFMAWLHMRKDGTNSVRITEWAPPSPDWLDDIDPDW